MSRTARNAYGAGIDLPFNFRLLNGKIKDLDTNGPRLASDAETSYPRFPRRAYRDAEVDDTPLHGQAHADNLQLHSHWTDLSKGMPALPLLVAATKLDLCRLRSVGREEISRQQGVCRAGETGARGAGGQANKM